MGEYKVSYQTQRGSHMMKMMRTNLEMQTEIERLFSRRTEATAWYENENGEREECGAVWKMEPELDENGRLFKWRWYTWSEEAIEN